MLKVLYLFSILFVAVWAESPSTTNAAVMNAPLRTRFAMNENNDSHEGSSSGSIATSKFHLPVEILGQEGITESRKFALTAGQVRSARKVFFFANNLGYQNKGAIQINDGDWVPLNHDSVDIFEKEKKYGGMQHGGFNSIRFTIPSSDLVTGENTVRFRFDVSDGISIGFRIVRFNLLDRKGKPLLPDSFFSHETPDDWVAPKGFGSKRDISKGEDLWYNASLVNHYLPDDRRATWYGNELLAKAPIKAVCADCHRSVLCQMHLAIRKIIHGGMADRKSPISFSCIQLPKLTSIRG